jgi:hypothetical protein
MAALSIDAPVGAGLKPLGAVALPWRVESAAFAAPLGEELFLFINRPGVQTGQFRLRMRAAVDRPEYDIEHVATLPVVAAGATACGGELLLTGADASGRPVLAARATGAIAWQCAIEAARPVRWPVPGCAWTPIVVWQDIHGSLQVAEVSAAGEAHRQSIAVGGPPVSVAVTVDGVYAAWGTTAGIEIVHVQQRDARRTRLDAPRPGSVAIGACGSDACCVSWTSGKDAFVARVGRQQAAAPPAALDLPAADGGRVEVIPGAQPLVWAQRGEFFDRDGQRWTSSLVMPGHMPLTIDGLVHAVAWCGAVVAIVGSDDVQLLTRERPVQSRARSC